MNATLASSAAIYDEVYHNLTEAIACHRDLDKAEVRVGVDIAQDRSAALDVIGCERDGIQGAGREFSR